MPLHHLGNFDIVEPLAGHLAALRATLTPGDPARGVMAGHARLLVLRTRGWMTSCAAGSGVKVRASTGGAAHARSAGRVTRPAELGQDRVWGGAVA